MLLTSRLNNQIMHKLINIAISLVPLMDILMIFTFQRMVKQYFWQYKVSAKSIFAAVIILLAATPQIMYQYPYVCRLYHYLSCFVLWKTLEY